MHYALTVVILTYNESIHIERAIKNVIDWADKVIVLDSYSQDDTVEKAKNLGAEVLFRKFDDYKNQRQFAIDYCKALTKWMLFLDADEYLLPELQLEIKNKINNETKTIGYYIPRRAIFMERWIKHGGQYPCYLLRLFRPETARLNGTVNEHVVVDGPIEKLKNDFVDHNLKNIEFWLDKHNRYTNFEAAELWEEKLKKNKLKKLRFHIQSERKKRIKQNIWNHLPSLWRSFLYFIYRYVFRLGFLDGRAGFIYHFLQGGFNFFLIDVKYIEMKLCANKQASSVLHDQ